SATSSDTAKRVADRCRHLVLTPDEEVVCPGDRPQVDPSGVRGERPGEACAGAELVPLAGQEGDRRRDGAEEAPVEEVERWTDGDHGARRGGPRRRAERDPGPEGVADEDGRGPGRKLSAERGQCRAGVVDLGRPAAEAASAPPGTTEVEAQGSD